MHRWPAHLVDHFYGTRQVWSPIMFEMLDYISNSYCDFLYFREFTIHLTGNPLVCDSSLCWAKSDLYKTSITIRVTQPSCASPEQLVDTSWNDINVVNLACVGKYIKHGHCPLIHGKSLFYCGSSNMQIKNMDEPCIKEQWPCFILITP